MHPTVDRVAFDARDKSINRDPSLIRLDDRLSDASFTANPGSKAAPGTAWEFDAGDEGWTSTEGAPGVVADGAVRWKAGAGAPGILSPPLDLEFGDLRAIEIRMSAPAARRLRLWWSGSKAFDPKFTIVQELVSDGASASYVIRTGTLRGYEGLRLTALRLDPSDGEAAEVAVESVRLIGKEGMYDGRAHGVGQEMIANESRHVLFHRAPSQVSWTLEVPKGARLDIGTGLLDAKPPAALSVAIADGAKRTQLLRQVVSDETQWTDHSVDLSKWGGRKVTLTLSAESKRPGQVVLWSNPSITGAAPGPRPPNVIVYLVDTLRADHLGLHGHRNATSPAIDALGAEGAVFDRCRSAAAWTRPSVASLVTSLPPPAHGVTDHGLAASDGVVTLAEQLRRAGYLTAAFCTSSHPGISSNLQQGYDVFLEPPAITKDPGLVEEGRDKDFTKKNSVYLNRAVIPRLDALRDRPFFLYIHSMDPHAPYEPPPPYDTMFATGYQGPIGGGFEGPGSFENASTPEELAHVRALYDGDIRGNDDHIGELIAALKERGLLDRTLVVITSDHGEEFREHGRFEHGQSLHNELLHVPLAMRLPGVVPSGKRVAAPVSGLDVMPTILEIAGLTANPDVQGRSLVPLMQGGASNGPATARPVFSWRINKSGEEQVAVEEGGLKAITGGGKVALYDAVSDPAEEHDLAGSRGADAERLVAAGRQWLEGQRRIVVPGEQAKVAVDEEQRKWFEALGYIEP